MRPQCCRIGRGSRPWEGTQLMRRLVTLVVIPLAGVALTAAPSDASPRTSWTTWTGYSQSSTGAVADHAETATQAGSISARASLTRTDGGTGAVNGISWAGVVQTTTVDANPRGYRVTATFSDINA